jgi:hypothetical protein
MFERQLRGKRKGVRFGTENPVPPGLGRVKTLPYGLFLKMEYAQ